MEELRRQRDLAQSQVDELRKKLQEDQQVSLSPRHIHVINFNFSQKLKIKMSFQFTLSFLLFRVQIQLNLPVHQ